MQVYKQTTKINGAESAYRYTYDANGNITSVNDGTYTTTYVYDSANQLLRENNQKAGKTWGWTYDDGGNIRCKTEYAYTTGTVGEALDTVTYNYSASSWGDLLISHDGNTIVSDDSGNMLSYGDEKTFIWKHGRELSGMTDDSGTWGFEYNADGLRFYRSNGTIEYKYYYNGDKLTRMVANGENITFGYDANGAPQYIIYGGHRYFYLTNLQGDVVAIVTTAGETVVEYSYDAWGNILTVTGSMANTLGKDNPLRYRGYVYDDETGLYYLQSRYYDPVLGRFINADGYVSTGQGFVGNNMFAYCNNNPVLYTDICGTRPIAYNEGGIESEDTRKWSYAYMNRKTNVDLTDTLTSFMQDNVKTLSAYKNENGYIDAVLYFYNNVKDGGSLDIKLQDDWTFNPGFTYSFNGVILRYDDPGNINFGYVGAVLFSEEVLCCGAGINQVSKWGFKYGNITTWFDDPRDNEMIKWGYDLYWEKYK